MAKKKLHKVEKESNNPLRVKEFGIGYNEENILLTFQNEDDNNQEIEFATTIPISELYKYILALYDCGLQYEKAYDKYMGFTLKGEE